LNPGTVRFNSNGTFILPPGVRRLIVDVVDGGGAGGGGGSGATGTRTAGAGGGGGARSRNELLASDVGSAGTSVSVTVGAQTGTTSPGVAGHAGNPSAFGTLINANGGGGGYEKADMKRCQEPTNNGYEKVSGTK
jgi:hypothetical protein